MKVNMKMVTGALTTCVGAVTLVSIAAPANVQANKSTITKTAGKPNILCIVADDLGWKDVGFNGAHRYQNAESRSSLQRA